MSLRRNDKALQCRAVQQKDQIKLRAIKMSFCVVAGFYLCFLPAFLSLIWQYGIAVSCLVLKVLGFVMDSLLWFSSTINPVICMLFVQSFRREFIQITNSCCSNRLKTYDTNNIEKCEQQKITVQNVRVTAVDENLALSKKDEGQSETLF